MAKVEISFQDNSNNEKGFKVYRGVSSTVTNGDTLIADVSYDSHGIWSVAGHHGDSHSLESTNTNYGVTTGETFTIQYNEPIAGTYYYGVIAYNDNSESTLESTASNLDVVGDPPPNQPASVTVGSPEPAGFDFFTRIRYNNAFADVISLDGVARTLNIDTTGNGSADTNSVSYTLNDTRDTYSNVAPKGIAYGTTPPQVIHFEVMSIDNSTNYSNWVDSNGTPFGYATRAHLTLKNSEYPTMTSSGFPNDVAIYEYNFVRLYVDANGNIPDNHFNSNYSTGTIDGKNGKNLVAYSGNSQITFQFYNIYSGGGLDQPALIWPQGSIPVSVGQAIDLWFE